MLHWWQKKRATLQVLMAAAISSRAVLVLPTRSHEVSTDLIVMAPPANWRWPQLDPLSSSDMSGEFGLAFSMHEIQSRDKFHEQVETWSWSINIIFLLIMVSFLFGPIDTLLIAVFTARLYEMQWTELKRSFSCMTFLSCVRIIDTTLNSPNSKVLNLENPCLLC